MKKTYRIMALAIAFMMVLGFFASAFAIDNGDWEKDVYAYGAGLNDSQIEETAKLLGIDNIDDVNKIRITAEDAYHYIKDETTDAGMISSVFIKKKKDSSGVTVRVMTDDNITEITPVQYSNAAITAGIKDAEIYVAAYRPVTGESALTGVYKAFEMNGEDLDAQRVEVANEELSTVNVIVQEHKDEEGFSAEKLNSAIIQVKEMIINFNENNGQKASREEIEKMINEALEKYEINDIVNQINIDNLVVFFNNFQNSAAIDSDEIREQLKILGNNIKDKLQEYAGKADEFIKSDEGQNFLQSIADFFKSIVDWFASLFK